MVPYVSAHQVSVTHEDLRIILSEANPLISSLSELAQQSILRFGKYVQIPPKYPYLYKMLLQIYDRYCDWSCPIHI